MCGKSGKECGDTDAEKGLTQDDFKEVDCIDMGQVLALSGAGADILSEGLSNTQNNDRKEIKIGEIRCWNYYIRVNIWIQRMQ